MGSDTSEEDTEIRILRETVYGKFKNLPRKGKICYDFKNTFMYMWHMNIVKPVHLLIINQIVGCKS